MYYFFRNYDRSVQEFRSALDMDPNFGSAHLWLAHAYQQKGLLEEALSELKEGLRLSGESTYALAKLGHGYALAGLFAEARSILSQLTELSKQQYVSPYDLAMIHVSLGESDEAFRWLELAYEQRSLWLGYLKVEPHLDTLRSDSRFRKLLSRLRLVS